MDTERSSNDDLNLTRIPAKQAEEIVPQPPLGWSARKLSRSELTPRQYLEALLRAELFSDAIRYLAFALPKREAIWWAGLFVLWAGAGKLRAEDAQALRAVVRWVLEPIEERRQEAIPYAEKDSPAGRVARGVTRTGGSIRPPTLPPKAPTPEMVSQAVAGAISRACLEGEAKTLPLRQRQAIALGLRIARGHFLWTPPTRR